MRLHLERERRRVRRARQRGRFGGWDGGGKRSALIDYYAIRTKASPVGHRKKQRNVVFPPVFSFIEAPDDALQVLHKMVRFVQRSRTGVLKIHQQGCTVIDLCAESVASVLGVEANRHLDVGYEGTFPKGQDQREIVLAAGIPKRLGVSLPEPPGFVSFGLVKGNRGSESAFSSSEREKQADALTSYINECLGRYGFVMGSEIAEYLASLVGEVIGNAEDHSSRGTWWISAYMHQASNADWGDCHVTIFDFGKTLSESLQELPDDALLRRDIEALVETHSRKKLFGPSWSEENLWTLYALQEGVSRYNRDSKVLGTRGLGTVDMIEFFQRLGQSRLLQPRMCVVSGATHISFDNRYQMKPHVTQSGETRRIIAFNAANDLEQPPESGYVRGLKGFFPGTLISVRFYLDKTLLLRTYQVSSAGNQTVLDVEGHRDYEN